MALSLKDFNRANLALVFSANILGYIYLLEFGVKLPNVSELSASIDDYGSIAILLIIIGILNAQINPDMKARAIFWRWHNPLPGSEAFSRIMHLDSRINVDSLQSMHAPFPEESGAQNSLWFKWYREYRNEPSVTHVHREYLFTRDWAVLTLILFIFLVPLSFLQMKWTTAVGVSFVLILEYLLVRNAAKHHGERLVATVLALKASE